MGTQAGQRAGPFAALTLVLVGAHALYWVAMPALATGAFSTDTGEALYWGREWQLGFYKHPPLSAWLAELAVEALGANLAAVYLVPQLCLLTAFGAVWWLARRLVSPAGAFLSVVALELFFNFTWEALQYNANVALLPFWAWTIALSWAAVEENRPPWWIALGAVAGLGALAKYAILILGASIALYWLSTPERRRVLASPGPWLALVVALAVASPHLYWLIAVSAQPINHAVASKASANTLAALPQLTAFLAYQVLVYLPIIAVLAVWALASGRLFAGLAGAQRPPTNISPSRKGALRFVLFVTFMPIGLIVIVALALAERPPPGWSYVFPITAGLLAVLALPWLEGDVEKGAVPRSALVFGGILVAALTLARPIHLLGASLLHSSPPRLAYDGRGHGHLLDAYWAAHGQGPLAYQVSYFGPPDDRALGSMTAFFSRFRPSVFYAADPGRALWINVADYRAKGGVVISAVPIDPARPFAGLCVESVDRLERPTIYGGYRPTFFYVGYLPPSPELRSSCR